MNQKLTEAITQVIRDGERRDDEAIMRWKHGERPPYEQPKRDPFIAALREVFYAEQRGEARVNAPPQPEKEDQLSRDELRGALIETRNQLRVTTEQLQTRREEAIVVERAKQEAQHEAAWLRKQLVELEALLLAEGKIVQKAIVPPAPKVLPACRRLDAPPCPDTFVAGGQWAPRNRTAHTGPN